MIPLGLPGRDQVKLTALREGEGDLVVWGWKALYTPPNTTSRTDTTNLDTLTFVVG